jgi:hypothetical protein
LKNRLQLAFYLPIISCRHCHNLMFSFLPILIVLSPFRLDILQLLHHPHILLIIIFQLNHSQYVVDVLNVAAAQRFNYDELQQV